jgi:hypothetical protein
MGGIELLKQQRFQAVDTVIIDVLECNPQEKRFWAKVGFSPHYTNMRMEKVSLNG